MPLSQKARLIGFVNVTHEEFILFVKRYKLTPSEVSTVPGATWKDGMGGVRARYVLKPFCLDDEWLVDAELLKNHRAERAPACFSNQTA